MPTKDSQSEFEEMISRFPERTQELARASRGLIIDVHPQVAEVVWPRQGTAGYGTGPKKMSEHFAWLAVYESHVNLGFNYGSELPDPEGLLEGTGALMRHVKVKDPKVLDSLGLRDILEAAARHRVPPFKE